MATEFFALDKTDKKIIAALEENSRQSNKAIAKKARANEHTEQQANSKLPAIGFALAYLQYDPPLLPHEKSSFHNHPQLL